MGSFGPAGKRRLVPVLAVCALAAGVLGAFASAAGPGGWDHLGDRGAPGTDSLDLVAAALAVTPGALYVGGEFTDAGGIPDADRIATLNGSNWSAVSSPASQISNGRVSAIAVHAGKVYAGGSFQDAGGEANADNLAIWDGTSWEPFCDAAGPAFDGNVTSLQIVGQTLYVGGAFQNGAGIASADYLLACSLETGASSSTVPDPAHAFAGTVYALTADSDGTLYAGGGFSNLGSIAAADNVAYRPSGGTWQPMGSGGGPCGCAVTTFVRGLTAVGTDVYVGTDANDIAGIPQADHVATWTGRRGARSAPTVAARTAGSRRRPRSTPWRATARTCSSRGRSRTRTAMPAPTTSPSSTAPDGTRSGRTVPATARGPATASPSRSSTAGSTRQGASPPQAATPKRAPPRRSRSRRSSPIRRRR